MVCPPVTSEAGARRPRSISNFGGLCQTRKTPTLTAAPASPHHAEGRVDPKVDERQNGYPRAFRFRKTEQTNQIWFLVRLIFFKT
jgi:hypothetical protein